MSPERTGSLVAFEGIEGAGKTTHLRRAAAALEAAGFRVRITAAPGGTEVGRVLRQLLLGKPECPPTPAAEFFLYLADRAQHVEEVIQPALGEGKIVLTDRFSASTIAYQGYGRGLGLTDVARMEAWSRRGVTPALNLLLDCPVSVGLGRAQGSDRFHAEVAAFHERVRQGFLAMAAADPERWEVIDATRTQDEVHADVMRALRTYLGAG